MSKSMGWSKKFCVVFKLQILFKRKCRWENKKGKGERKGGGVLRRERRRGKEKGTRGRTSVGEDLRVGSEYVSSPPTLSRIFIHLMWGGGGYALMLCAVSSMSIFSFSSSMSVVHVLSSIYDCSLSTMLDALFLLLHPPAMLHSPGLILHTKNRTHI